MSHTVRPGNCGYVRAMSWPEPGDCPLTALGKAAMKAGKARQSGRHATAAPLGTLRHGGDPRGWPRPVDGRAAYRPEAQDGEQAGQTGSGVSRSCRPRRPIQSASCPLGPYARWRLPSTAVRASHSATRSGGRAAGATVASAMERTMAT